MTSSSNNGPNLNESCEHLLIHPEDIDENVHGDGGDLQVTQQQPLNDDNDNDDSGGIQQTNSCLTLPKTKVLAYSVGHFYNDLCASMWFTYLLIFLEKVVLLYSWEAGFLMLLGQVIDAISTPLIGLLSDHSILPQFLMRFGRRKSWHLIGTCCVTLSFPFIFSGCLFCHQWKWLKMIWFILPIIIFQFGWAAVQISHLALIPELTSIEHTRMSMNSLRYANTVIANLTIFGLLFLFLRSDLQTSIGPEDLPYFRNLGLITIIVGLIITSIFYAGINETNITQEEQQRRELNNMPQQQNMKWYDWFTHSDFYLTAALYLFSRVYINISQVYFSFYITQSQSSAKTGVALLPLTAFVASFLVSFFLSLSPICKRINIKFLCIFGTFLGFVNCALFYFTQKEWTYTFLLLYGIASLLGVTQAILLISSLNTTATLINKNTESAAFVYGAMSFLDKFLNGSIIQIVELFNPSCHQSGMAHLSECDRFYRIVISVIPAICVLLITILMLSINLSTLGQRQIDASGSSTLITAHGQHFESEEINQNESTS